MNEDDLKILREIKQNNESKAMIIHNNTSNLQINWSSEDLKNMAEVQHRCARENRAIDNIISAYNKLEADFKEVDHECRRLEQKEYEKEDKYLVKIKELMNNCITKQRIQKEIDELNKMIKQYHKHKNTRYTLNEIQVAKTILQRIIEED